MDRVEEYKENEIVRNLKSMINKEIDKRIDAIVEAQKQESPENPSIDIDDYRDDIEHIIRDFINYEVTINA